MIILMVWMLIYSLREIYIYGYNDPKVTTISAILSSVLGIFAAWLFHRDFSSHVDFDTMVHTKYTKKWKIIYLLIFLGELPIGMAATYYHLEYILLLIMIPLTIVLTIDIF